jgi:hypothetical protein
VQAEKLRKEAYEKKLSQGEIIRQALILYFEKADKPE